MIEQAMIAEQRHFRSTRPSSQLLQAPCTSHKVNIRGSDHRSVTPPWRAT